MFICEYSKIKRRFARLHTLSGRCVCARFGSFSPGRAAACLQAFLPTGSVALAMHVKNGLVETSALPYVLLPALAAAAVTSAFAREAAEWLGRVYGGFLMLIAAFGLSAGVARNFSSR